MTKINIELEGLETIMSQLRQLGVATDDVVNEVIENIAMDTHGIAVSRISGGGTGRVYQKSNPRRTHRASAPGAYPATDTGRLVSSIKFRGAEGSWIVGTNVKYGAYLEFGTSRMDARPWLMPSFEQATANVVAELRAKLEARL